MDLYRIVFCLKYFKALPIMAETFAGPSLLLLLMLLTFYNFSFPMLFNVILIFI